uniref:Polyprotein, putative n=1 Tax=Solanum demissum TaxID=50514 RepID=Q0KIU2_SOLDE|nr:Polyprotein, putative [Solanum demissum]
MVTVRTVIAIASMQKWDIYQMDVYNAFLQGDLNEEVYMDLPLGFAGDKGHQVCKLHWCQAISAPLEVNKKLTSLEFDQHMQDSTDPLLSDPGAYQSLVGRLLYLTIIRLDIAFAVQCLSQYMHSPKESHMVAAARVIRYVKQSPSLGVFMSAHISPCLTTYYDADWASCVNTRKSVTGFLLKLGDSPVSWKSKKQSTISRSSAEDKYRNLASAVAEVVQLGLVNLVHVSTTEQQADIFTKGLGVPHHTYLVSKLGMKNIFIDPSLRGDVEELMKCTTTP